MRWPESLQARLALGLGLGLAILWLATAWVTAALLRGEMDEVFDSALQETAQRILPLAVMEIIGRDEGTLVQRIATLRPHDEYFVYVVRDETGRVLMRSHGAEDAIFPPFDGVGFRQTATHRIYQDAAVRGTITIAMAEPLEKRAEVARETLMRLALPLLVIVPLGLAGVLLIVRRSLRPVRRFSGALAERGASDLSAVESAELPDEIAPVAEAINHLLDRLRRTLEAERSFTANAAHELRTPVAAALAQIQRLMAETSDTTTQARAAEIETALKRLTRLSEKLMQLARAEGSRLRHGECADLRPALQLVLSDFERSAGTDRIAARLPKGPVLSDMDADAFAILARNLIENALRHGGADAPVRVDLSDSGQFRVTNGGPPVPPELLRRLIRRFERGGALSEGSGLGLSIARAIAEGAGGTLTLHSPAKGRADGFEAVFQVPTPAAKD